MIVTVKDNSLWVVEDRYPLAYCLMLQQISHWKESIKPGTLFFFSERKLEL